MTRDILKVSSSKHVIHGLVEVDVTDARRQLAGLSFTAFVIHCLALALSHESRLNAVRRGRRVYTFDTVNIGMMVEAEDRGSRNPVGVVIRDAARKSIAQINADIRTAQRAPASELARQTGASWFMLLPGFARRAALRYMLSRPTVAHQMGLVTGVTSVGMFGRGAGWGIAITSATVAVTVGGIGHRPAFVDGRLEDREYVCLTVSFDHDLIDGAPAARFTGMLTELMESADGLDAAAKQSGLPEAVSSSPRDLRPVMPR